MKKYTLRAPGFTIVELLIVVIVVAILATLTVISFGAVRKSALVGSVQTTLQSVGHKFETVKVTSGTYPTTEFPADISTPSGIGLALTNVASTDEFCVNGTAQGYADIAWHIDASQVLSAGLCSGEIIESSIIGNYETPPAPAPETAVVIVEGSGGGFKLETDEAWNTFTLSWTPVDGATRYEIQTKTAVETNWQVRSLADGGICHSTASYCYEGGTRYTDVLNSARIMAPTTSLAWTNTAIKPTSSAVAHDYRYRSYNPSTGNSAWSTLTLTPKPNTELTKIKNFRVTAGSNWSTLSLSWDDATHNSVPSPNVEIQTKPTNSSTWLVRNRTDGSICHSTESYCVEGGTRYTDAANSAVIPIETTSLGWTNYVTKPSSSTVGHDYRIRLRSTKVSGMYSDWVTYTLNAPSSADMAKISNFTVTPTNDWATFNLAWNISDTSALPSPTVEVQTKRTDESNWFVRIIASGSECYSTSYPSYCMESGTRYLDTDVSAKIPVSTTSLAWTSYRIKPSSATVGHDYRIRVRSNSMSGVYSDWITANIAAPSPVPAVSGFTVTPAGDWSSITFNWDAYSPTNLMSPSVEIQTKASADTSWWVRNRTTGGVCNGSASYCLEGGNDYLYATNSAQIPINSTSLTWTSSTSKPTSGGGTHNYRIRVRGNGTVSGVYSPWTQVNLTRP